MILVVIRQGYKYIHWASQVVPVVKNLPANAGEIRVTGLIPGSGRSPGDRGFSLSFDLVVYIITTSHFVHIKFIRNKQESKSHERICF